MRHGNFAAGRERSLDFQVVNLFDELGPVARWGGGLGQLRFAGMHNRATPPLLLLALGVAGFLTLQVWGGDARGLRRFGGWEGGFGSKGLADRKSASVR